MKISEWMKTPLEKQDLDLDPKLQTVMTLLFGEGGHRGLRMSWLTHRSLHLIQRSTRVFSPRSDPVRTQASWFRGEAVGASVSLQLSTLCEAHWKVQSWARPVYRSFSPWAVLRGHLGPDSPSRRRR